MRRLLDRAVAASSNGIIITDPTLPDNPIVYVNSAFEKTTGYAAEEALGRNCRFLQGSERDQPVLEELRGAIREERECRVVLRNYRKDGAPFWNELHVSPVRDDRGSLTHFVGVQNDVTERKRAEEERDLLLARERQARAEADAARGRLALLAAAGPILSASLDYEATLRGITRLVVPGLADWCLLDIVEDGVVNQVAAAHTDPARESLLRELRDHRRFDERAPGSVARVLRTGRPLLISEVPDSLLVENATSEEHLRILRELEVRSYMSVPLLARGRTLGAATIVSSRKDRRYDAEDLALVENLAYRCALAVDNARLYREQSYVARTLQRSLLPRLPEVPGFEVGAAYLPVGEENEVGGDFYDLMEGRGGWIAVVGDVRGKGAVAASVTALARYTIRAVAMTENGPANILSALNEAMIRQLSDDYQFCTVACALLCPESEAGGSAELTVARGGHPPPLVLRSGGYVEEIGPPSRALGVFPDPELGEGTSALRAGDAVVLYTDGVTEARSVDGSFFGEGRLRSLLRSCTGLDASAIAEELRRAVLNFQQGEPRDDLAVLVLRVPERA
jgi:PAS domain S-box-containing protein